MKFESLVMQLFFKLQPSFKMNCEAEGGFLASSPSSVSRAVQGWVQGALLTAERGLFKGKKSSSTFRFCLGKLYLCF